MCRNHHLVLNPTSSAVVVPRNLIPEGLKRFTQGPLPKQSLVERISPCVTCILGFNPSSFTLNGTNIYLVGTGKRRILIDAGEQSFRTAKVIETLETLFAELGVEGIDEIICSHLHHDHVGGAKDIAKRFGPCRISKYQTPVQEIQRRERVVREEQDRLGITDFSIIPKAVELTWQGVQFERDGYHRLFEGDLILTEGASLRIFFTPGHASDHIVVMLEEERAVFTGDHILGWGTSWVDDLGQYVDSLHKIDNLQAKRLYPGHGPCVYEAKECISRYISHRHERETQVLNELYEHGQVTAMELVHKLYPPTAKKDARAMGNVVKILLKLERDGFAIPSSAANESWILAPKL